MQQTRLCVADTVADVLRRRPALRAVVQPFEPLLTARAELAGNPDLLSGSPGALLPVWDAARAAQGQSLLPDRPLRGIDDALRRAGERLVPLLCALEPLGACRAALEAFFTGPARSQTPSERELLLEHLLAGNAQGFERIAEQIGVPPDLLEFGAEFVFSTVLRSLTARLAERPWDTDGAWRHGYCPVCGTFPILSWLDRPVYDEKNAFLSGGGGKKHLYCGLCGTIRRFPRGVCPSCGSEDSGTLEILRESKARHGERVEWCIKCRSYCPGLDLRECDAMPDPDVAALGMVHLDMAAARKKLHPLKNSFWNRFEF